MPPSRDAETNFRQSSEHVDPGRPAWIETVPEADAEGELAEALTRLIPATANIFTRGADMPRLSTGDHVPNFELPDQQGDPWILRERLRSGPTVLVFYRGDW